MTTDMRSIARLLLIAATFTLTSNIVTSNLRASLIQEASKDAILIQEEVRSKPLQIDDVPQEDTVIDEEDAKVKIAPAAKIEGQLNEVDTPVEDDLADESSNDLVSPVAPAGKTLEILTKEQVDWICWAIYLLLALCFLAWLLSLMTAKPNEGSHDVSADSNSGSGSTKSKTGESASDFGKVFSRRPAAVDDLTKIGGIDAQDQQRLNEAGIWQFDQLKQMTAQQRSNLQRKLNLPRIRWYSLADLSGAASTAGVTTESRNSSTKTDAGSNQKAGASANSAQLEKSGLSASGDSVRVDAATGNAAAVRPPKFKDDLAQLPGVDKELAAKLNKAGIQNVNQLQAMNKDQRAWFEKRFGIPFAKLKVPSTSDHGKTVGSVATKAAAAGALAAGAIAAAAGQGKAKSTSGASNGSGGSTESPGASGLKASTKAAGSGIYTDTADSIVSGSSAVSKRDKEAAARTGKHETRDEAFSPQVTDETFGVLYTAPPSNPDDLTQLAGIDSAAAARLNAAGIYTYDQLKDLDDEQAASLAKKFDLPEADFSDWRRCIYAWGRGIQTTAEGDESYAAGTIHGIALPQIANGVFDGEKLVAYPEQVIFRGSNPEGWGRGAAESIEGVETSLSCDSIRSDINFLRIRRTDTRESVVVPMTKGQLFANGDPNENGWNGSSEVFFGGRHIGVFAQDLPQEVETKFSQGGWGFGHRYDHNDRQEWGWAGRVIEPTTFEVSVGCIGDTSGTVVFRSSDPSIWNTKSRDGEFRFADPVDTVKHPVNFVRIMREATGEAVIVRVDGNHVLDEGFDPRCGWNGSCSEFSGGQHLGVYHCDLAQDFETRFEFGGWGFGHPYNDNDRQAWGWAGRQLPETVFEISLLDSVPEFMQHELVS